MIGKIFRVILFLGLLYVLGWLIYESTSIILYLLISAIVALIGRPFYLLLDRVQIRGKSLPGSAKAAITLVLIFGIIGGFLSFFLPLIFSEAQLLATIDLAQVKEALGPGLDWFNDMAKRVNPNSAGNYSETQVIEHVFDSLDIGLLPQVLNSLVGALGNLLIAVFSVAFISFFFLKDKNMLTENLLKLTPRSREDRVKRIIVSTRQTLSRYFLGLLLQVVAITLCIFVGLTALGVENALLIAAFTGIVNLIPYLGPWIGASFGVFIVVANNLDASFVDVIQPKLIGLVIIFGITQMLDNYIFQPIIFSNSINAHPLEIFVVILVAGSLGGVGGMIAAIPVYSFLRILFKEMNKEFLWLQRLKSK